MDKPFCMRHYALMQGACAMRISTDALFLGAWARTAHTAGQILDVGTGTGILSLMLAQTYPSAMVTAIDVDDEAIRTAQDNFCCGHSGGRNAFTRPSCAEAGKILNSSIPAASSLAAAQREAFFSAFSSFCSAVSTSPCSRASTPAASSHEPPPCRNY